MLPITDIQKAILSAWALVAMENRSICPWSPDSSALRNCSGISLHQLEADKFAPARLVGKLANVCPDLPSGHLEGTAMFKSITGGDRIVGERKYKDSFEFVPFARLVFSANSPPRSTDSSEGFFDRWIVIPFERCVPRLEKARYRGRTLGRNVVNARKRCPVCLNRALDAIRSRSRYGDGDSIHPKSISEAHAEFRATTDPFSVWLDAFTITDVGMVCPCDDLRNAYGEYCERKGIPRLSEKAFSQRLQQLRPRV